MRHGVRAGRRTVVVHALQLEASTESDVNRSGGTDRRVGFVVSKQVGNAVIRNRVKRRLRHLARAQLGSTPAGIDLVVRALPRAASSPTELESDLTSAWSRAVARVATR